MLIIGSLHEPFVCCRFTTGFTEAGVQELIKRRAQKAKRLPDKLKIMSCNTSTRSGTYTYYFGKLFGVIFQANTFASESVSHLSIQCKEEGKKSKERPRLSRADKQQLHITHLNSKRTEIALKAPTLTL